MATHQIAGDVIANASVTGAFGIQIDLAGDISVVAVVSGTARVSWPVQNHIHLSRALQATGEKAPTQSWIVEDRRDIPHVVLGLRRTLQGPLRRSSLWVGDSPLQLNDYRFIVKVRGADAAETGRLMDQLKGMLGHSVYFCDNYHPNDGDDHTSAVKAMVLSRIGRVQHYNVALAEFRVEIELSDDTV